MLLNIFVQIVNAGLQVYLALLFYSSFSKRKCPVSVLLAAAVGATAVMATGLYFFRGKPIVYLFTLLPALLLTFLYDVSIKNRLIYFAAYNAIEIISELLVGTLLTVTMHIKFNEFVGAAYIIGMLASKLTAFIVICVIRVLKRKKVTDYYKAGNIKAFLFPIASLFAMVVQYLILKDDANNYDNVSYLLLFSYTLLIVSNVLVFDYIDALYTNALDKESLTVANEIIEQQRIKYDGLIKHHEDIVKIQHNSKHIYLGLISEIESGNYTEALSRLKELTDNSDSEAIKSGNIIHIIVESMRQKASADDIEIDFSYNGLDKINIPSTDLAIILGNALENAIEASKKVDGKKTVQLFIQQQNETVIISIKNPTKDDVDISNLESTKSDPESHGYGILSMRTIAAKYGGEVAFSCSDHLFTTAVVLNNIN